MKKSRIKFIKKAHNVACSDWKAKIETEFSEIDFNKELEVGEWYKYKTRDTLSFISHFDGTCVKSYGLDKGEWYDDREFASYWGYKEQSNKWTKPTAKEVEDALIKEAKRKYKLPCKINYLDTGISVLTGHCLDFRDNSLYASNFEDIVFQNGKWAEIITKKEMTVKDIEKELGYEVKIVK